MVCRLCYNESEDYIEIFSEEKISKYINKFLELEITRNDTESQVICALCWQQIKAFQSFYVQIKEAQRRSQNNFKKESPLIEKELAEMEGSTFEYVNTETETDLHENTETLGGEELSEHIVPDSKDTKDTADHPYTIKKKGPRYKKMTRTTRSFKNSEERRFFVELMKKEEVIWNRSHKQNSSSGALINAWKRVASSMPSTKTVNECKVMWKSLRDALRYQRRKAALGDDQNDDLRKLLSFLFKTSQGQTKNEKSTIFPYEMDTNESFDNSQTESRLSIQNYHVVDNTTAAWSERTGEGSDISAYSEKTPKVFPVNEAFKAHKEKPINTTKTFCNGSTIMTNTSTNVITTIPLDQLKTSSNRPYDDVKLDFKNEIYDLVESISSALKRLVTIATTQVQQVKLPHTEFKYEYIWKLIECLYLQIDLSTINDLNQRIINMVYESCKANAI